MTASTAREVQSSWLRLAQRPNDDAMACLPARRALKINTTYKCILSSVTKGSMTTTTTAATKTSYMAPSLARCTASKCNEAVQVRLYIYTSKCLCVL